jgi:hypothetical protein
MGKPRERWEDDVRQDAVELLGTRAWKTKVKDTERWKQRIEQTNARFRVYRHCGSSKNPLDLESMWQKNRRYEFCRAIIVWHLPLVFTVPASQCRSQNERDTPTISYTAMSKLDDFTCSPVALMQ